MNITENTELQWQIVSFLMTKPDVNLATLEEAVGADSEDLKNEVFANLQMMKVQNIVKLFTIYSGDDNKQYVDTKISLQNAGIWAAINREEDDERTVAQASRKDNKRKHSNNNDING